jgi:ADP-dependent NAD(P)H-hydrate dehydratase / NAD(P)H-hydrate epimerase
MADKLENDPLPTAIFSIAQLRVLEQSLMQAQSLSAYDSMQKIGELMWQQIRHRWPNAQHIAVCCGPGNNAGDSYVIARLAKQQHKNVCIITERPIDQLKGAARLASEAAIQAQVRIEHWAGTLPPADLYIDALFGIGLQRDIDTPYRQWIGCLNQVSAPIVAIDVPSGIDADTGAVLGVAVKACLTLCALALKVGLLTGEAVDHVGEVQVVGGDLLKNHLHNVTPFAKRILRDDFLQWPARPRNTHKGLQGHVLIIGGDIGMGGAVILAAEAALRAGAGLVSIATRAAHVNASLSRIPEVMVLGVDSADQLLPLLSRATVAVIGPGLGQSDWSRSLLQTTLDADLPLVIDADALNLMALNAVTFNAVDQTRPRPWVLTPHPKEAARLLCRDVHTVQRNRPLTAQQLSTHFQAVVLLKGAGTLIASPVAFSSGSIASEPSLLYLIDAGNPGMAVAAMGDVLTGIIAAIMAQTNVAQTKAPDLNLAFTTAIAAWLHATAGDEVAACQGVRGMRASDLLSKLPQVMQSLENNARCYKTT